MLLDVCRQEMWKMPSGTWQTWTGFTQSKSGPGKEGEAWEGAQHNVLRFGKRSYMGQEAVAGGLDRRGGYKVGCGSFYCR